MADAIVINKADGDNIKARLKKKNLIEHYICFPQKVRMDTYDLNL
jgi:hypothetical protein